MTERSNPRRFVPCRALLAGCAVFFTVASSEAQEKFDRVSALKGEAVFRTYCTSCHGRDAMGTGPLAKDLKIQPANLTELSKRNDGEFPFDMVIKTIDHGRNVRGHGTQEMPAWGDAFEMTATSSEEAKTKMQQLAQYLWSLQKE